MNTEERHRQFEEMERAVLNAPRGKKRKAMETLQAERLADLRAAVRRSRLVLRHLRIVK